MSEGSSKRKKYTLTYKQAVVAEAKKSSNRAVAQKHALDESFVRRWRKINDDLLAEANTKTARGETRSRRSGGWRHAPFQELEKRLFEWIVLMRQCRRRVTRKSIKQEAKNMHKEANGEKPFEGSSGWCQNFLKRFRLATRIKTHQSQRAPLALVPKLLGFLSYMRSYFHDHPERELRSIFSMDETAVWYDAVSTRTVDFVGAKSVSLMSTGHDKQNVTVALSAAANGLKKLPYVVFKGKGKTVEDRELKTRCDIVVAFSDNGWFNTDLTIDWLRRVMGALAFSQRLLIWDSYRCHICPAVDEERKKILIYSAVVSAGCTGLIQAPDVSWNKVFKSSMREQYNDWLENGDKSYTKAGNIRAVTKTQLCNMIVQAWSSVSSEIIAKSFECCGQVPGATAESITCSK